MASAYDVFKPEFDKLSEQEKMDLSMAGLIAYRENGRGGSKRTRPSSSTTGMLGRSYDDNMGGFDLSGDSLDTRITDFDDQSAFTLVDRMRRETYRVKITNALADIVDPLGYIIEDDRIRKQLFDTRMHNEHFLYYRAMISAINNLRESNADNFIEGLVLQYRNFMRHPIWNTFRLIGENVIRPLFNMAQGVLFGFKKRESDSDRIINAIHDQTEFLRKGESGGRGGFFSRLITQGVVGMPLRALGEAYLGSFTGITRDRAQQVEDARAAGEQRDKSILDRLSMSVFGGSIDRKGNPAEVKRNSLLEDVSKFTSHSSMFLSNIKLINQSMLFELQQIKESMGDELHTDVEMGRTGTDDIRANISSINKNNRTFVEQQKAMGEIALAANDYFEDIEDNTKESSKTLDKIRGTQMFRILSSWARTGINLAGDIASAITGSIGSMGTTLGTGFVSGLATRGLLGAFGLKVGIAGIGAWAAYRLTEKLNEWFGTSDRDVALEREARLNPAAGLGGDGLNVNTFGRGGRQSATTSAIVDHIKELEGFRSESYKDITGKWTIGYGTTRIDGKPVTAGMSITKKQAEEFLMEDFNRMKETIKNGINADLNENQLNALTSLAYNVGPQAVLSSSIVPKLESGRAGAAADAILSFNKATIDGRLQEVEGLTRRRREEAALFRTPMSMGSGNNELVLPPATVSPQPVRLTVPSITTPAMESANTIGTMNTQESVSWLKGIKGSLDGLSAKFGDLAEGLSDWVSGTSEDGKIASGLMGDD